MLFIGAAKITLDFYGNDFLDKKSSEIKKLAKLVSKKFPLELTEVDAFEDPEKCVLAFCICGPSESKLKKRVEILGTFIDKYSFARVVSFDREYFRFDE